MNYPQGSDVTSGLATFYVARKGGNYDVATIQVMRSTEFSTDLQQEILKANGHTIGNLAGVSVLQNQAGNRVSLLPTIGNGCGIVRQGMEYAP